MSPRKRALNAALKHDFVSPPEVVSLKAELEAAATSAKARSGPELGGAVVAVREMCTPLEARLANWQLMEGGAREVGGALCHVGCEL